MAFERAEATEDENERVALLTFLIVGGGPTGVELAGAIAELARSAWKRSFVASTPRARASCWCSRVRVFFQASRSRSPPWPIAR